MYALTILGNFLWENEKVTYFFTVFSISH